VKFSLDRDRTKKCASIIRQSDVKQRINFEAFFPGGKSTEDLRGLSTSQLDHH
jgi:hypothetical protein